MDCGDYCGDRGRRRSGLREYIFVRLTGWMDWWEKSLAVWCSNAFKGNANFVCTSWGTWGMGTCEVRWWTFLSFVSREIISLRSLLRTALVTWSSGKDRTRHGMENARNIIWLKWFDDVIMKWANEWFIYYYYWNYNLQAKVQVPWWFVFSVGLCLSVSGGLVN